MAPRSDEFVFRAIAFHVGRRVEPGPTIYPFSRMGLVVWLMETIGTASSSMQTAMPRTIVVPLSIADHGFNRLGQIFADMVPVLRFPTGALCLDLNVMY